MSRTLQQLRASEFSRLDAAGEARDRIRAFFNAAAEYEVVFTRDLLLDLLATFRDTASPPSPVRSVPEVVSG